MSKAKITAIGAAIIAVAAAIGVIVDPGMVDALIQAITVE